MSVFSAHLSGASSQVRVTDGDGEVDFGKLCCLWIVVGVGFEGTVSNSLSRLFLSFVVILLLILRVHFRGIVHSEL